MPTPPAETHILFAGGGTGGHLFPGIAVAQELRRRHPAWRITFVGTARGIEARAVPKYGFALELLPVTALRGKSAFGTVQSLVRLLGAGVAAWRLVHRLRPQVAIGVGGYAAGPAILAAYLQRVPVALLEQNAHAGLTNRALAYCARHILLAMPNAQLSGRKGAQLVGNPVRSDVAALRGQPADWPAHFDANRPLRLLVVGGSQGASALNCAMVALLPLAREAELPLAIQHQTGVKDEAQVKAAYEAVGFGHCTVGAFIDDMAQAYRTADAVICRSGASTLAELAVVGRPSVLVPYPFAADDHQTANARVMQALGASYVVAEAELTPQRLLEIVAAWVKEPLRLAHMAQAAASAGKPEAVHSICDIVEAEVERVSR